MTQKRPLFLLDENLNRLAKWLRALGYDVSVYKKINTNKQIQLAIKERRILLTRDKKKALSKLKFHRVLIKSQNHFLQLQEIRELLDFQKELIFTRCLNCNKLLFAIEKTKIKGLVPQFIYNNFEDFKVCRRCGKIYWQGSHFAEMKKVIEKIFL